MQSDPSYWTLQVRLQDVFGDNGMIAVVICRAISPEAWEIDTWLMSCRVLGRGVEHMSLRELLHHARAAGVKKLKAVYYPTEKNKLVLDHYSKLGFTKTEEEENGATHWEFDTDGPVPEERPMLVISEGFQEQLQESIG
jgi:FkbH-like protein